MYPRHGFYEVGTAYRHARIAGRYVDEIVIEKLLVESRATDTFT